MPSSGERYYEVQQNDKYGRYLVAGKDLERGEVIFVDSPFAIGPKPDSPLLCLGCYRACGGGGGGDGGACARCGWPLCGAACPAAPAHTANECAVFADARVKFQPVEDGAAGCVQLDCIAPLRILLEKERHPERWSREMEALESHTASRQKRATWAADQVNVADYLVDHCKLASRFDKELVQRVCGILEVNSVEIPSRGGCSVRGVYPQLSLAAHHCVPNLLHSILAIGDAEYQAVVRAAVPIEKGFPLFLSYAHALSPTPLRRCYLLESKFFECDCERCADPSELGTHMSTLECAECDNGLILATNPLDSGTAWKCTHCEFTTSAAAVMKILAVVQAEIDQVDCLEPGPALIDQRELILEKYRSVLHPKHSLFINIKHSLAQLYGRAPGCVLEDLPDTALERKLRLCREVLAVLDTITPGASRMRGVMLYELHVPLVLRARNEYRAGRLSAQGLRGRAAEALRCLGEAAHILACEDPRAPEGVMGRQAARAIHQLKASMDEL